MNFFRTIFFKFFKKIWVAWVVDLGLANWVKIFGRTKNTLFVNIFG